MHVEVGYLTQAECRAQYGQNDIQASMMCAADAGKDSCQGGAYYMYLDINTCFIDTHGFLYAFHFNHRFWRALI